MPIALVSLVDLNRQWFKSCIGIDVRETSRDVSFCTYAILQDEPLVVEDATRDPRFANNPYVVGEPGIRAYAGMPLRGPTGYKLGTLCLIDRQTRRFSESDINDLKDLASIVENELGAVELNEALAAQRQTAEENARLYQSAQRELSQRRKAEAERAEALESLQKAVLELERLSAAKSTFVSTVSHEFRTGLTSVLGFSDLLRTEELTGDEVRSFGELIGDTSRRLNRMINELLDLDRIESGLVKLQREPVSVNDLVRRCVSLLEMTMADHSFHQELDPSDPCVLADDDRLVQVLTNLISNAVKYSPDGGAIEISTRGGQEDVHLSVRDHGLGIPAEEVERIFDRYTRVDSGGGHSILGTGLGLPIVREIVALHDGKVWAESSPGAGSAFHVVLPAHREG